MIEFSGECPKLRRPVMVTAFEGWNDAADSASDAIETLELAAESGTSFNGVLCGRATWKDGIKVYATKGAEAFEDWLNTTGVENINNVNKALEKAHSWHEKVDQYATLHEPVQRRSLLLPIAQVFRKNLKMPGAISNQALVG